MANSVIPTPAFYFAVPDSNGIAPDTRCPSANDAFVIADQLRRDNTNREWKWGNIYKCYKRFNPTDYSLIAKKQLFGLSNVPFGMLTMAVDEKKSGYIDMITDRSTASNIRTKKGNDQEQKEWSDLISFAWDRALWEWDSFFSNQDQDLEEMLLYGKGIEVADSNDTWHTTTYKNNQVLVPDNTKINLSNLGEFVIKDFYTPLQFWNKFKDSKDYPSLGWNFWACLDALRYYTNHRDYKMSNTQYLEKLASGNINFNQYYSVYIHVYIVFIKEWDGKITKSMVLQNYTGVSNQHKRGAKEVDPMDYAKQAGYLYLEQNFADSFHEMIFPFHGAAGSGIWHDIKGYGEDLFPAARIYDITKNKQIDAINLGMMAPITGATSDATKKLKQMEWGNRFFIMPEGADFAQKRFEVPIGDAQTVLESVMGDTERGVNAANRLTQQANPPLGGRRKTATCSISANPPTCCRSSTRRLPLGSRKKAFQKRRGNGRTSTASLASCFRAQEAPQSSLLCSSSSHR